MHHSAYFNQECSSCQRLEVFLDGTKQSYPGYYAYPVAPFGDIYTHFLVPALALGMQVAHASRRPFTGHYAGLLPYRPLFDVSFSNRLESTALSRAVFADISKLLNQ
ncbi:MAG: hypothetical protein ACXV7J_11100 [Methylomonas sp.]